MMLQAAKNRYPAFLICVKNGTYTPWPGPACVNRDLQPESVWGDAGCPPQDILNQCLVAEMAAVAAARP